MFRALRHRNFRLFFIGQGLSVMGTWLQTVAMGWLTYRISGSVFLLGVVAFCTNAGILFLGTFAGVVADHVPGRNALRITQSLALLQAATLAVLTWSGHIAVWHLIVLALWLGIVHAFDVPLRQSLWVHLVEDRADLPNVVALNSTLVNTARIVGPALAGLLLAVVSEAACFALNALSFVAVIIAIGRMRWVREPKAQPWEGGFFAKWVEGYRYVSGFAPARAMLLLVAVLSWTIAPYSSMMPAFAKDIYGGGPETLGFLLATAGAGALVSSLYLASRATIRGLGRRNRLGGRRKRTCARRVRLSRIPSAGARAHVRRRGRHHARLRLRQYDPAIDRSRRAAGARGGLLHAGVHRHVAARQSCRGRTGKRDRRPGDVRGERCNRDSAAALIFLRGLPKWRALMRPTYRRLGIIPADS
jgi:hypothetical protein